MNMSIYQIKIVINTCYTWPKSILLVVEPSTDSMQVQEIGMMKATRASLPVRAQFMCDSGS